MWSRSPWGTPPPTRPRSRRARSASPSRAPSRSRRPRRPMVAARTARTRHARMRDACALPAAPVVPTLSTMAVPELIPLSPSQIQDTRIEAPTMHKLVGFLEDLSTRMMQGKRGGEAGDAALCGRARAGARTTVGLTGAPCCCGRATGRGSQEEWTALVAKDDFAYARALAHLVVSAVPSGLASRSAPTVVPWVRRCARSPSRPTRAC